MAPTHGSSRHFEDGNVISMITRLRDVRFVRYILASVGALAVDVGSFLALLSLGVTWLRIELNR